jgi:hypothetical protein
MEDLIIESEINENGAKSNSFQQKKQESNKEIHQEALHSEENLVPNQESPKSQRHKIHPTLLPVEEKATIPTPPVQNKAETEAEELEKQSKPFLLTKIMLHRPYIILTLFLLLEIISIYFFISKSYMTDYEDTEVRTYLISDSKKTELYDAQIMAKQAIEDASQQLQTPLQSQPIDKWLMFLLFKTNDGDTICTEQHLQTIRDIEHQLVLISGIDRFCFMENGVCSPTAFKISVSEVLDLPQPLIDVTVPELVQDPAIKLLFSNQCAVDNIESPVLRSLFYFAAPVQIGDTRYLDKTDRFSEQEEEYRKLAEEMYDFIKDNKNTDGLSIYIVGDSLFSIVMDQMMNHDLLFALVSMVLVYIYITIHLESIFLSSLGMLQVLLDFPVGFLIYNEIFRIKYYANLHILIIFILLGISADNFFVFTDAFNQAKEIKATKDDLLKRISYTFRRATKAISVTSSTTAVAFLATATSDIMPIATFGIFAFTMVAINYLLTITLYPCFLVIHSRYLNNKCLSFDNLKKYKLFKPCFSSKSSSKIENQETSKYKPENLEANTLGEGKYGAIEKFFNNKWSHFINKLKYIFITIIIVYVGISTYFASQLESLKESETFFPDDHDMYIAGTLLNDAYHQGVSDLVIKVDYIWGVKGIDRSRSDWTDSQDFGTVVWDHDFQVSSEQSQLRFIDICDVLEVCFLSFLFTFSNLPIHTILRDP